MANWIKSAKWLLLLSGLLIVVLGFIMFFTPLANLWTLAIFIGISMLIAGASEIASFINGKTGQRSGMLLAGGILSTLFGIWVVFGTGRYTLTEILPFLFAIWVMSSGIMRIAGSTILKSEGHTTWGWILALGVLEAILGFVLLFHPLFSAIVVSYTLAFMFITYGIHNVLLFFDIHKYEH